MHYIGRDREQSARVLPRRSQLQGSLAWAPGRRHPGRELPAGGPTMRHTGKTGPASGSPQSRSLARPSCGRRGLLELQLTPRRWPPPRELGARRPGVCGRGRAPVTPTPVHRVGTGAGAPARKRRSVRLALMAVLTAGRLGSGPPCQGLGSSTYPGPPAVTPSVLPQPHCLAALSGSYIAAIPEHRPRSQRTVRGRRKRDSRRGHPHFSQTSTHSTIIGNGHAPVGRPVWVGLR